MQHAIGRRRERFVPRSGSAELWRRLCGLALTLLLAIAAPGAGGIVAANAQELIAVPPTAPGLPALVDGAMLDSAWTESGAFAPGGTAREVSESIVSPVYFQIQMPTERVPGVLYQQDATDATAGSAGQDGTVNGVPRETTERAPAETIGAGSPGQVMLPPSVPGVPAGSYEVTSPNINPALAAGIGGTTELVFDAVSDTTVFTSSPGSPQSSESLELLAVGGDLGAVAFMSFEVSGVGEGTVLAARLTFYGAGAHGSPGGSVGVIYDFIAPDGLTANGAPGAENALNVHGAPAWFERVEPDGMSAVDVTGSVGGDGTITFVLPGQPEEMGSIYALESGAPAQLILTVALPA